MNQHVIRLTSVTYAARAQKLLEQRGIRSHVKKVVKNMSVHGCGYGVEVSGEPGQAVRVLEDAGIRIVEVTPSDN